MVDKKLNLKILSIYRSELMGIAIILIMCFHCNSYLFAFGFIGVEIFLAISALGLYFSLQKDFNIKRFYRKRILRIVPAYFIVAIPYLSFQCLNSDMLFIDAVKRCLQISTLEGTSRFLWFISAIFICYIITPYCLKYKGTILSYSSLFLITLFCFTLGTVIFPKILIERLPIFLVSLKFSSYVYDGKSIYFSLRSMSFLMSIIFVVFAFFMIEAYFYFPMNFDYLLASFITIPFLIVSAHLIQYFPLFLVRVLKFMGSITLELYLLHELICIPCINYFRFGISPLLLSLLSFLIAIILAFLLHRLITTFQTCLKK